MKHELLGSLENTMQDVLGVHERIMEQTRNFCLDAVIFAEALDLFKSAPDETPGGGPGASALDA